jgi:hypothetical protein
MTGGGGGENERGAHLRVVADGVAMAEDAARELWRRFSAYMEEHRGDLGGFARSEGFVSAHPRSAGGQAVLVLSRTEPQEAYGAPARPAGNAPAPGKRRRR